MGSGTVSHSSMQNYAHTMGRTYDSKTGRTTGQEDRTNHYNNSQGAFRYGILDINSLRDRIVKDARGIPFEVEVTHCDEMDRLSEFSKAFGRVNAIDSPLV